MIKIEKSNGVAKLTFENRERRNAMNDQFIGELTRAMGTLGADHDVRAIILAAEGSAFCAGGDLNWMRRAADYDWDENVADIRALGEMLQAINETPKPVIARVQGSAFGGGVGMLCACDIVLAVPAAKFSLSETRLGLIPGVISPFVLGALGPRQARRYALTGEVFDAATACEIGLVHQVLPESELDRAVEMLIVNIKKGGPKAVAGSKSLMRQIAWRPIDDALIDETASLIAEVRAGAEAKEGVSAFLEKRTASWIATDNGVGD